MDYVTAIKLMPEESLVAMLLTAIDLLACEDNYLTMSKQEIFELIYRYSFEEDERWSKSKSARIVAATM